VNFAVYGLFDNNGQNAKQILIDASTNTDVLDMNDDERLAILGRLAKLNGIRGKAGTAASTVGTDEWINAEKHRAEDAQIVREYIRKLRPGGQIQP
jgi:hypothetical protein